MINISSTVEMFVREKQIKIIIINIYMNDDIHTFLTVILVIFYFSLSAMLVLTGLNLSYIE